MSQPKWIEAAARLPRDGQVVLVKTARGIVEHRVTFRTGPEPRWESSSLIAEFEMYPYWRPLSAERTHAVHETRAAPP